MLAHGIQVDQRPGTLCVIPEQVVPLEIAMADAFAQQGSEQSIQRQQLGFRGRSLLVCLKTRNYILPTAIVGNQVRAASQPAPAPLDHSQRRRRDNAQQLQTIAFAPTMPGATGPPEALEPVQ